MYRQIQINPKQTPLQTLLWRDSPAHQFGAIELTTVAFGHKSSPFLACRVLKDIAQKNPQYPHASKSLLSQTYVDDILTGANSIHDLKKLESELHTTFLYIKFTIIFLKVNQMLQLT